MDRFIEAKFEPSSLNSLYLKSNMDRFIVNLISEYLFSELTFKIQYG